MPKNNIILLILGCFFLSSCISAQDLTNFSQAQGPRYARLDKLPAPEPDKRTLKVVSYNLDLCENIKSIPAFLRTNPRLAQADIILLQEMDPESIRYLAEELGCNYVYYPSAIHPQSRRQFGQAILSRWRIEKDKKIPLPFGSADRYLKLGRCAVEATVTVGEHKILVFCLHLGVIISPQMRQEQLRAVLKEIPEAAGGCIIAGDFNTYAQMHTKAVNETLEDAGFTLATKNTGWTYKYWYLLNHKTALDFIFYRGLKLTGAGKISDRSRSDHLPIWADFEY